MPRPKIDMVGGLLKLFGRIERVEEEHVAQTEQQARAEIWAEPASPLRAQRGPILDQFTGTKDAGQQHHVFRTRRSKDGGYDHDFGIVDEGRDKNCHVDACCEQVVTGVTAEGYSILPRSNSSGAKRQAKFFEMMLKQIGHGKPGKSFLTDLKQMVRGGLYGLSFHAELWELVWWDEDGNLQMSGKGEPFYNLGNLKHRHPASFIFDAADNPRFLSESHPIHGEPLTDLEILIHRFDADFDNVWGNPWYAKIYWDELFIRWAVRDWVSAAERVAWPIPVVSPPPGRTMDAKQQARAAYAMKRLKSDSCLINADGFTIENLDSNKTMSADFSLMLISHLEGNISKSLLGQEYTIDPGDGANRSLGDHLVGVATDRLDSLIMDLETTIDSLAMLWCELNFPDPEPPFFSIKRKDHRDIDQELSVDESMTRLGIDQKLSLYLERYGREMPAGKIPDPSDPTGKTLIEIPDFGDSVMAAAAWWSSIKMQASAELDPTMNGDLAQAKDGGPAPGQKAATPKRPGAKEGKNPKKGNVPAYRQS